MGGSLAFLLVSGGRGGGERNDIEIIDFDYLTVCFVNDAA